MYLVDVLSNRFDLARSLGGSGTSAIYYWVWFSVLFAVAFSA
jgi:hypothetical protein